MGFALEIVQADVLARHKRRQGCEVVFNTGTDEHGQKIYQKAIKEGLEPQVYVDEYAKRFKALKQALNLSYTHFIRTTDKKHKEAAQEMWRRCAENGFIEKGVYEAKYCVGCEMEKTDSELEGGRCPLHPKLEIEVRREENYFFKFSRLQKQLLAYYEANPDLVKPKNRFKEVKKFVAGGLRDFSISRLRQKMPWGIPVPGDGEQVMYVWFDALTNYVSTLGWPKEGLEKFWGSKEEPKAIQVAGKDNLRQQAAIWQAMLMAAGLPPSKQIFIHGFITANGQKMSKSLGNVVNPFEYVKKYGTEALRYFLLAKLHPFEDSDFTREKFEAAYNDDLANGLGNLVARVESLAAKAGVRGKDDGERKVDQAIEEALARYRFDEAMRLIWEKVKQANTLINQSRVWQLKGREQKQVLEQLIDKLKEIGDDLEPFLPRTSEIIRARMRGKIERGPALFPRLN